MSEIDQVFSRFAVDTRADDLPALVRHEAVRAFVNYVGCVYGGCRDETFRRAWDALGGFNGSGPARVLGWAQGVDMASATFWNTLSSTIHVFDDTHLGSVIHPTGPVASAVLAIADDRDVTGVDAITALAIGIELECRLACALTSGSAHTHLGWFTTGLVGGLGAAAASGRLLGADPNEMRSALGLAATQAAGLRVNHGRMGGALPPAAAARNGLVSALLAKQGFEGSPEGLDGANGFLDVLANARHNAQLLEGLGTRFELLNNSAKPYPCGVVIHPAIDCSLALVEQHGLFDPRAIERIIVDVHPLALDLTGLRHPSVGFQAKASLYHWIAVALVRGRATLQEATDACVSDAALHELRARVDAVVRQDVGRDGARLTVRLANGTVLTTAVAHCRGTPERPMTDNEIGAKFLGQAAPVLGEAQAAALLDRCWAIETAPSARALLADGAI